MPAQRHLLRFVDDAHATTPHLTQQAIVADTLQRRSARPREVASEAAGVVGGRRLELLHHHQCGKEVENLLGVLGVARRVFGERRTLTSPVTFGEFFRQSLDRLTHGRGLFPRWKPG